MDNVIGIVDRTCPICGKYFIVPIENTYKIKTNGCTVHYCSYTCFRKAQAEKEKNTKKCGRKPKGDYNGI